MQNTQLHTNTFCAFRCVRLVNGYNSPLTPKFEQMKTNDVRLEMKIGDKQSDKNKKREKIRKLMLTLV